MSAGKYSFIIEQGTFFTKWFQWTTATGTPINLAGYTPKMKLRKNDGSLIIDLTSYLTLDAPNGKVTLSIPESVTTGLDFDNADYDIKLSKPGATSRLLKGQVVLDKQVTD